VTSDPPREPRPSLAARLLGTGARGASAAARVTGVDKAAELALEEAIVSALESEAVERAMARVLEGPAAEEAIERVMASPAVERAILNVLDSQLVDEVWDKLLASDEAQKLVERIAEAPEVRAAITQQGVGMVEDLGRQVRGIAHRFDRIVERLARRLTGRTQRAERSNNAGLITRALALAVDAAIVNGTFFALSALATFAISGLFPDFDRSHAAAIGFASFSFVALTAIYLHFFWTLTGQTPGMRFLGIRLDDYDHTHRLSNRSALRRLWGMLLCVLTLGIGFLIVLWSDRRRGLHDRIANTEVILVDRRGNPESEAEREALDPRAR
jgi:uncharacterized RDD family membrane protein YckC